jgi:endonuclease/exonuclease/phosphatase family metal-dependent hydrolase
MKVVGKLIFLLLIINIIYYRLSAQEKTIQFRILTFNIYHGATINNDYDLNKIAQVINSANPDLVSLQEVDYKTNRAKKMDISTELARLTHLIPLFGRAMYYDNGEYGIAVLSKYSFIKTQRHLLPYSENHEPRVALEVLLKLPLGDTIRFVGAHLDHTKNKTDRINQIKEINRLFSKKDFPTILAGDMNTSSTSMEFSLLKEQWTDSYTKDNQKTYPSDKPERRIDYILYKPQNYWRVIEYRVICNKTASDHCAVFTILEYIKTTLK